MRKFETIIFLTGRNFGVAQFHNSICIQGQQFFNTQSPIASMVA